MDLMMRNGVLGTALCLIGLQSAVECQLNWKNSKVRWNSAWQKTKQNKQYFLIQNVHHDVTAKGKTIVTTEDLDYFANSLANERNFVRNLDKILIPRTVGSEGSRKVREVRGSSARTRERSLINFFFQHIQGQMRKLGWKVEEHSFTDRTPLGNKEFKNVIATLNPQAPRR